MRSAKIEFIIAWNVAEELHIPKNMTVGFESCFPLVTFFYSDIIITPSDIQFSEIFGILEFIHDF